jgi:hypothetical protein
MLAAEAATGFPAPHPGDGRYGFCVICGRLVPAVCAPREFALCRCGICRRPIACAARVNLRALVLELLDDDPEMKRARP